MNFEWNSKIEKIHQVERTFWETSIGNELRYTIEPIVKPKRKDPIGYMFSGWSSPDQGKSRERRQIQGNAKTAEECKTICESHSAYVRCI